MPPPPVVNLRARQLSPSSAVGIGEAGEDCRVRDRWGRRAGGGGRVTLGLWAPGADVAPVVERTLHANRRGSRDVHHHAPHLRRAGARPLAVRVATGGRRRVRRRRTDCSAGRTSAAGRLTRASSATGGHHHSPSATPEQLRQPGRRSGRTLRTGLLVRYGSPRRAASPATRRGCRGHGRPARRRAAAAPVGASGGPRASHSERRHRRRRSEPDR